MANIRKVKERGRKLPNVLNKKQLIQLFESFDDLQVFMGSLLSLFCGLRISEVCHLKKLDFDFEQNKIKIEQGKGNKDRFVMLPEAIRPLIDKWFRLNKGDFFL